MTGSPMSRIFGFDGGGGSSICVSSGVTRSGPIQRMVIGCCGCVEGAFAAVRVGFVAAGTGFKFRGPTAMCRGGGALAGFLACLGGLFAGLVATGSTGIVDG